MTEESEKKGLGMQLIRGLTKELKGILIIEATKGTKLSMAFKKDPLTDKVPFLQEENMS